MSKVEKKILADYKQFMDDYDPMAEGLFESWNWTSEIDFVESVLCSYSLSTAQVIDIPCR